MADNVFTRFFSKRTAETNVPITGQYTGGLFGLRAKSGVKVTVDNALTLSAVYTAINVVAQEFASLPGSVYKETSNGTRQRAADHAVHKLIHNRPNPNQSPFAFKSQMMVSLLGWGNAFAEIEYNTRLEPIALWPLDPNRMNVERTADGTLVYHYQTGTNSVDLSQMRVLHIALPGKSGDVVGMSPIGQCREAVGLGLSMEQYGAYFFANGANMGGFIQIKEELSDPAYERLKRGLADSTGLDASHRWNLLEGGAEAHTLPIANEDAQFLQSRRFQLEEIARLFRVPLTLMGVEGQNRSVTEQDDLNLSKHTLRPLCVLWEEEINNQLIAPKDRGTYYLKFNLASVERGDMKTRYEAYALGRNGGWLSVNKILELEDMEPVEGGDTFLIPLNMGAVGPDASSIVNPNAQTKSLRVGKVLSGSNMEKVVKSRDLLDEVVANAEGRSAASKEDRSGFSPLTASISTHVEARAKASKDYRKIMTDAQQRVVRREVSDIKRAAKKYLDNDDVDGFRSWLDAFIGESPTWMRSTLNPVYDLYIRHQAGIAAGEVKTDVTDEQLTTLIDKCVTTEVTRHAASTRGQIQSILDTSDDPATDVTDRMDEWDEKRADKISASEVIGLASAAALAIYAIAGITRIRWSADPDACPICQEMDGMVVGIEENFASAGQMLSADGADDITVSGDRAHPPLHKGCTCSVEPEDN